MKFLPYDRFELETQMDSKAIIEAMKTKIAPRKLFRFSSDHAPFQGEISSDGFEIIRIIHYRNSFLPVICGKFQPNASGTRIIIKMRLHAFVAFFMCVWFGGVGLGCFVLLNSVFNGQKIMSLAMLIPFGMLIFGWALVSGGFWFEAKKQKPMLVEMFNDLGKLTDKG